MYSLDFSTLFRASSEAFQISLKRKRLEHHEGSLKKYKAAWGKSIPEDLRMMYKHHKESAKALRSDIEWLQSRLVETWGSLCFKPEESTAFLNRKYESTSLEVEEALRPIR